MGNARSFLERTRGFVHPLQYSAELTIAEATAWLRSEKLRDFPRIAFVNGGTDNRLVDSQHSARFVNRGTDTCNLIATAYVWSRKTASFFPPSCKHRVQELLLLLRLKRKRFQG